jgi:hypothetical protein
VTITISVQHRRTALCFSIKRERDDIFIAQVQEEDGWGESIFLTKSDSRWVGDCSDKKLVEKIGAEIDAICWQKVKPQKKKPA